MLIFRRWLGEEFLFLRAIGTIRCGPRTIPSSVIDWFTLLHTNPLVVLTLLNVFDIVNYLLVGLIFLSFYAALRRAALVRAPTLSPPHTHERATLQDQTRVWEPYARHSWETVEIATN